MLLALTWRSAVPALCSILTYPIKTEIHFDGKLPLPLSSVSRVCHVDIQRRTRTTEERHNNVKLWPGSLCRQQMVFGFLIEPNEDLPGGAPANDVDDVEWLPTKMFFKSSLCMFSS